MVYKEYDNLTVYEMLKRVREKYSDSPLFSYMVDNDIKTVTYREFFRDMLRLAKRFDSLNLKGERIVIGSRNTYEQALSIFSAITIGAIAVPLNMDLPWEDLTDGLNRLRPAILVYDWIDQETAHEYEKVTGVPCLCSLDPNGGESISRWLATDSPLYEYKGEATPNDPALILMTSGTTSRSKLAVLSHYSVLPHLGHVSKREIMVFPLYHVGGIAVLVKNICQGAHICLSNFMRGVNDIDWFRPESIITVPLFIRRLVKKSKMGQLDLSCFNKISNGAAPQDLDMVSYLNSCGIFSESLYGSTEVGGAVNYATPEVYRLGSLGKPGPWNEVKISEKGEILVKGNAVMIEYWEDPDTTREALQNGWLHTGDIGYMDADGFLFVSGRLKNVIILPNGENISSESIEEKLYAHPAIEEVIVKGDNEIITALIWCGNSAEDGTRDEVKGFISQYNQNVPSYYRIRDVIFRDAPFDKTASGKIKR